MNRSLRWPALLAVLIAVVALLTVISSESASAASTPPVQWPPVNVAPQYSNTVTAPNGEVTVGCDVSASPGQDLITYNAAGAVVRQISRTTMIDGVNDCIGNVIVDKNATIYGVPLGYNTGGSFVFGPNLLAYSGNTLKWKYPIACTGSQRAQYAVGADGNIYATNRTSDGVVHLIGLTPTLAAGHTVPTKVLDVNIGTDCTTQLFPYKDGIMLQGQSSGTRFYSLTSGNLLRQPSGMSNLNTAKVNANGRMFSYNLNGGSYTSSSIYAYDPTVDKVVWTTPVSTSGADTNGTWFYPLANGGAVAIVNEQRMVGGVPASPTEWVFTRVILNAAGTKVSTTVLPNVDGSGNQYDGGVPTIVPEVNGKFLMVRQLNELTTPSGTYPPSEPAVEMSLVDPATGTATYTSTWQGNTDGSGGSPLYGYTQNYSGANGPITGPGVGFNLVKCVDSCPGADNSTKLYPVAMTGIGLDYPRGELFNAYPRPTSTYIALGDSFSSGEGNPPFDSGTDIIGINECHRSSAAYPRLISGSSAKIPALGASGFRACSGATTENVWEGPRWNERTQLNWMVPDTTTKLVTITIGGNDIKFSDFGNACFFGSCAIGSLAYNTSKGIIDNDLAAKLTATYQAILAKVPNAKVYVLGYPQVVPNKTANDPIDARCPYLYDPVTGWNDVAGIRDIVTRLDAKISTTITAIGNSRLRYVDPNTSTSPFKGHELCGSGTSAFQNVNQAANDPAYVFHPNALGQQGYATLAKNAINAG